MRPETVWNATGDVWKKVETGSRTITWRPDHSWPDHKIADGGARAVVTAWALDNTPDYMAVDLTATGGADTQTYYPAADFVPGGVTNGIYKTTKLLMRKIMAKDVTWTMGSVAEIGRTATPALASASCALPDCGKHVRSGSRAAPEFDARNDTCYDIAHLGHSRKQMKGKQR